MDEPTPLPALDAAAVMILQAVSTATVTTLLLKKGLRNVWLRRARPLREGQPRTVGRAFTLRFVPGREDLSKPSAWSSPRSTRMAVEAMPRGCFVVVDAMGVTDAGVLGDILCARMVRRGVAGLVTDGAVRDGAGVRATGLPTWAQGTAAPGAVNSLSFVDWQQPVGCGGVAVFPGEVIVADDDGAVLIPEDCLADVLRQGPGQERLDAWTLAEVNAGAALPGLYPPDEQTLARYARETS